MYAKMMKKRILVPLVLVGVLALSGAALAFWSGLGSGSGTASVGTGGGLTIAATVDPGIFPGGNVAVAVTVSNPAASAVRIGTLHLAGITVDAGHAACVTSDFTMPDVPENNLVPPHAVNYGQGGATLYYANTASNQDPCQGATLTLNLTSS